MKQSKKASRLQVILDELKKPKKSTLRVSWVNRKGELKSSTVRVAGIAYDGRGGLVVVLRNAKNTKMLFNLPIGRITAISGLTRSQQRNI